MQTARCAQEKHVLSVLVDDEPGILARISGMLAGRGFNIASLTVAGTGTAGLSRMTVVLLGDHTRMEQVGLRPRQACGRAADAVVGRP